MIRVSRVSVVPSGNRSRGPVRSCGLTARNDSTAATGHIVSPVRPRKICTPFPKGSVLDWRRCTRRNSGGYASGRWISEIATILCGQSWGELAVNSPMRRKPKKPRQQAAQMRRVLYDTGGTDHWFHSTRRISAVIGSLLSGCVGADRLIPLIT